jgi:hypothetical protein
MEKEFRVKCVALLQSVYMTCTILAESEEEARKKMENMGSDYLNQDKLLDELARYDVYIEDIEDIEIRQVGI